MKIWLDTANCEVIKKAVHLGILYGVTTNPAILAETKQEARETLQGVLDCQDGPVTAQVTAKTTQEMVEQGKRLYDFSDRIIVKVPVTAEGIEAIHSLEEQAIPTMATVIFHAHQAILAALVGAHYVAPYIGQIERMGNNPWEMLQTVQTLFQKEEVETQILAASLDSLDKLQQCAALGIDHVTLKESLFRQWVATDPQTQERVNQFLSAWQQAKLSF